MHVVRTIDPAREGLIRDLRQLAGVHRGRGHRAEVVAFDPPDSSWATEFPLPVYTRGGFWRDSSYAPGFSAWLRERCRDFDAVIVHGMRGPQARATWRALYGTLTPYFLIPHGELKGWPALRAIRESLGWPCVLRDASGVIFTSAEESAQADRSSRLHLGKAHLVPEWTATAFVDAIASFGYRG